MKIDGKALAEKLYKELEERTTKLKKKHITPTLAVILIGNNPASALYVNQKQKHGEKIGAKVIVLRYDEKITEKEIAAKILQLNNDNMIHGILLQQPLPPHLDAVKLERLIDEPKEVDGLRDDSPFVFPLSLAMIHVLQEIHLLEKNKQTLQTWLQTKNIVVIGKGETGGKPLTETLEKMDIPVIVVDSKTKNSEKLYKQADIIIPAVGKPHIIKAKDVKKGVILIGVGQHKAANGKFYGDFDEKEVETIASYYTPTPGGMGAINVACLMENLITAAERI